MRYFLCVCVIKKKEMFQQCHTVNKCFPIVFVTKQTHARARRHNCNDSRIPPICIENVEGKTNGAMRE